MFPTQRPFADLFERESLATVLTQEVMHLFFLGPFVLGLPSFELLSPLLDGEGFIQAFVEPQSLVLTALATLLHRHHPGTLWKLVAPANLSVPLLLVQPPKAPNLIDAVPDG